MDNKNTQISQLKNEINKLPKGNITYKIIRGKRRMYLQWYEDGATKSSYVKKADEENIKALVNRRKELEFKLRMEAYASKITEDMLRFFTIRNKFESEPGKFIAFIGTDSETDNGAEFELI